MKNTFAIVALCAASVGLLVTPSYAQFVAFSDSFSRTAGSGDGNGIPLGDGNGVSDWGMNDNALGGVAVQSYTFGQGRAGGANQTTDGMTAQIIAGAVQIEYDFATIAPTGFEVDFDFTRVVNADATTPNPGGFVGVALGVDDTDQIENQEGFNGNTFIFTNPDNGADAAVLIRQNNNDPTTGTAEFFSAGVQDVIVEPFYNNPHDTMHSAKITIDAPNGYGAGQPGTLTLSIDGGTGFPNSFTFDGVSSGYLSLYSNLAGSAEAPRFAQIDNLVITAFGDPPAGLPGDFNGDDQVNLADYTLWRNNLGSTIPLDNDDGLGTPIGSAHYNLWKSRFGSTASASLQAPGMAAVPEPATAAVLLSALAGAIISRRVISV